MRKNPKHVQAFHFGVSAEKWAAWYLRLKGYRILAERYRNGGGEIDIIACKWRTLVAVEVKARRTLKQCEEAVPPWKQKKIARAMEGLLAGHRGKNATAGKFTGLGAARTDNIRFDVMWVAPASWPRHIKDAWRL